MRDRKIAVRYAQALLDVAMDRGKVDGITESFDAIAAAMTGHKDLLVFMQSPQVRTQEKKQLIETVFAERVEPAMLHFLELLLDKDRIMHLGDIHEEYSALVEIHRGVQRVRVVTAVPLPGDLEQKLAAKLAALTGKTIILDKKVDPSVIGGVCVTMGDQIIDGTVATGLSRLGHALEQSPLRSS
ncbi:MAG: ATP synthase F1 subunit delta [Candidatus Krumholzibacteriia bacterium]